MRQGMSHSWPLLLWWVPGASRVALPEAEYQLPAWLAVRFMVALIPRTLAYTAATCGENDAGTFPHRKPDEASSDVAQSGFLGVRFGAWPLAPAPHTVVVDVIGFAPACGRAVCALSKRSRLLQVEYMRRQ